MDEKVIKSMKDSFGTTKQRCYNPKCRDYPYYGGRGITICDRWLESFDNYLEDMGLRPAGMTLERKDNDGPYSPENCVWATRSTQGQNTRKAKLITYQGETHTMSEWERRLGWKAGTLKARLGALKYTVDEAFTKPVLCGGLLATRTYTQRRKPDMSKVPRGLASPQTRLTRDQVIEARRRYQANPTTYTALAREFNVCIETMSQAVQGHKAYSEVTNDSLN